jgi:TPR repeat protein
MGASAAGGANLLPGKNTERTGKSARYDASLITHRQSVAVQYKKPRNRLDGSQIDQRRAFYWLRRAAKLGNQNAANLLVHLKSGKQVSRGIKHG